jgi:hypothetical protein
MPADLPISEAGKYRLMISKTLRDLSTWLSSDRFRRIRMRAQAPLLAHTLTVLVPILIYTSSMSNAAAQSPARSFQQSVEWSTHGYDAQHTGVSPVASQKLARIHWQVPVDLAPPEGEILIHYGSPVITTKNTVIVPVKTGTSSFRVQAHDGTTGQKLWTLGTAYQPPFAGFMPGLGVTLSQHHLFVPDVAGGILMRANPDNARGKISHLYFYGLKNYLAHPGADVGVAAAAVLANPEPHIGKVYELTGAESMTMARYAQEFSRALGRTIHYVNVPPQIWEA